MDATSHSSVARCGPTMFRPFAFMGIQKNPSIRIVKIESKHVLVKCAQRVIFKTRLEGRHASIHIELSVK